MKVVIYKVTEPKRVGKSRTPIYITKYHVFEDGDDTPTLAEFKEQDHAITFAKAMGWDYELAA
jgi:hypothetical protein